MHPFFVDRHFSKGRMKPLETCHGFHWGEPVYTGYISANQLQQLREEITQNDQQLHHLYSSIHPFIPSFNWSLQNWVGITTVSSAAPCNSWTRSAWSLRSFCSSSRITTWAKVGNSTSFMWQGKVPNSVNVRTNFENTWIHFSGLTSNYDHGDVLPIGSMGMVYLPTVTGFFWFSCS